MSGQRQSGAGTNCASCGSETPVLRDGICLECWYTADQRPKPVRDRFAKLGALRELDIDPYAYSYEPSHGLQEALELFEQWGSAELEGEAAGGADGEGPVVTVAGRLLSLRDLGGSAFGHLGDSEGRLQVYFKRNLLDDRSRGILELLDLSDWIGVQGPLFRTRTGEVTVRATRVDLLSKSIRPLPLGKEEVLETGERVVHSGFSNTEMRYRQRYADLAVNPEIRELFRVRARVVTGLRAWLDSRGFVEVETPILQPQYGGALARPFTTEHNALDTELYLRVADELYLKRLIVGNLDRVYEIAKDFRNEGIDRTHNPEFTMLELYQAYADYEDMMQLIEEMVSEVVAEATGTLQLKYGGHAVDMTPPWTRLTFAEALEQYAGIDMESVSHERLTELVEAAGKAEEGGMSRTRLLDALFSAAVEPELTNPTIIYDYPLQMSPLAKKKRGNPGLAERFEVIVAGSELVNAFSELNDPLDQYSRFAEQNAMRAAGDLEAHGVDEDYVRALEYGLPPTGGLGMGVDRLLMLITGRTSIREVILFPILRPEEGV